MGDMADWITDNGIDAQIAHDKGECWGGCPYCEEEAKGELQMTDDQTNQTIHEARGLHWHTHDDYRVCSCGIQFILPGDNPDYTSDWSAWGAALEWAQGEEWWGDFVGMATNLTFYLFPFVDIILNPEQGATALAKFIDENPKYFTKEEKR